MATSVADSTKSASATVTPNPTVTVTMSPARVTLTSSQSQAFSALVTNGEQHHSHLVAQPGSWQHYSSGSVFCALHDLCRRDGDRDRYQCRGFHEVGQRHRRAYPSRDRLRNAIFGVFAAVGKSDIYGYGQRQKQHRGHLVIQPRLGKLGERCDDRGLRRSKHSPDRPKWYHHGDEHGRSFEDRRSNNHTSPGSHRVY